MNRLAVLVLISISATAQLAPDTVRKVVDVKHLSGDRADRAVALVRAYMHPVGSINFEQSLRTAVLIGPEKVVTGAEALLAKFDAPGAVRADRQMQLRVHLVEALPEGAGGPIPAEIASAVEQMKKNFAYKGYRHVDTVTAVVKDGVMAAGTVALDGSPRARYSFRVQSSSVLEDGKTVALKNFRFEMAVPYTRTVSASTVEASTADTHINTDLTVQQGQKLVVGKLASGNPQNAIFLIVTVDVQ